MSGATRPERPDALQRLWLRQLLIEHEQICWQHGVALRPPVFEITANSRKAGSWSADLGSLQIADWLITNHSWDVVVEVVKHEMAHQYVHEVMAAGNQRPHGAAFQEACQRLAVHPRLRGASAAIPLFLQGAEAGPSKVLAKVEKLLALAASPNEHEAVLAMEKANDLLRRHNISRLDCQATSRYSYLIINEGKLRISAVQRTLAAILKDFFFVKVIISRQFDAASARNHRVLELIGAEENLAVAEHVYFFLRDRLTTLWQEYRRRRQVPGRLRRSYQLGILKGLQSRLARQEKERGRHGGNDTTSALVCSQDQGLIRFYRQRHPRLRRVSHRGPKLYSGSYQAGRQEGRKLVIHKTVVKRRQGGGLLSRP